MDVNPTDPNPVGTPALPQQAPDAVDLSAWFKRLVAAEQYMRDEFKPKYDLARKRLRSEMERTTQKGGLPVHKQVNLVYSIGTNFINSVYFKNPNANFTAKVEAEHEAAENTEIKVNDFFKDKKLKRTIKRCLWDAYLGGFGAIYSDYYYDDYETGESATDDLGNPIPGVQARAKTNNAPIYQRIRPELFRFPRGFSFETAQDSPWLGFDILMTVDEIRNNPQFKNTENIQGSSYEDLSQNEQRQVRKPTTDDLKWAKIHYIFIKPALPSDRMKCLVLCSDVKDNFLKHEVYEKGQVGYPLKFVWFNPLDDDNPYPCGDPWIWESQLNAVDKWWKQLSSHIKHIFPKIFFDKKNLTLTEINKATQNEDQQYIGIDAKGQPLERLLWKFEHSGLHKDVFVYYENARQLLSELAPKSALSRGAQDAKVDTATAANIIHIEELIDLEGRIDDVREFIVDLMLDCAGLFETNFQGSETIRGTLANGTKVSRIVERGNFTSRLNIDVDVESMQSQNREIYRKQLTEALVQLKTFEADLAKKGKALDGEFFVKRIAETFNIRNIDKAIIELNVRDAAQEECDNVFKNVPFQIQAGEDSEKHLMGHMDTIKDQIKSITFEKLRPGFMDNLQNHILDTQQAIKTKQSTTPASKPMSAGRQNPMISEMGKAMTL